MTGGLLIKELGKHGYATHYQELAYALVSQESEVCYLDFMSSLRDLVSRVASLDLTRVPQLQIHGDQAGGLEAARKKVFPDSVRVADFAHIIGARRNEGNQDSQAMKVWRSGIFKTVDSHLRQGSYLSLVEFAVYTSRCASPGAFAAIWESTLKFLDNLTPKESADDRGPQDLLAGGAQRWFRLHRLLEHPSFARAAWFRLGQSEPGELAQAPEETTS